MNTSPSTLTAQLTERLDAPLPGHEAQLTMAPRASARREHTSVEGRDCREAGVLVVLIPYDGETAVVLTVRRDHLPDHAGQISFPGGQREAPESLQQTALREAEEEVALSPDAVTVLGSLTPLYIPPSNFCVHPFVAALDSSPHLRPTDREVRRILRVPLSHLLDPDTRQVEPWTLHGEDVDVPFYALSDHAVWGATAMMLAEFLAVIREATTEAD